MPRAATPEPATPRATSAGAAPAGAAPRLVLALATVALVVTSATGGTPARAVPGRAAGFTLTDLGTAGAPAAAAVGVNSYGKVVGNAYDPASGDSRPVVWHDGRPQVLGPAGRALQVNNRSQVIGTVDDGGGDAGGGGGTHAVVWDWRDGSRTVIRPEALFSTAVDLNDRGEVLIWYALASAPGPPEYHAAVWYEGRETPVLPATSRDGEVLEGARLRPVGLNNRGEAAVTLEDPSGAPAAAYHWFDGRLTDVGSLGGPTTEAAAIDEHGWIAGTSTTAAGDERAFLWQDGTITDLGTLGGPTSRVTTGPGSPDHRALSDAGHVVGTSTTAAGDERAFLWQDGTITDLGTLGGPTTRPTAVNDRGQVVGRSHTGTGDQRAFHWDRGRMVDLGTLGGTVSWSYDLTEAGVVVGASRTGTGAHHAALWETDRAPRPGA